MTVFLVVGAALALLAAAFVVVPLLRRPSSSVADRRAANVALYREREAALDAQLAAGEIDADEHEVMRAESAASLLADAAESSPAADGTGNDSGAVPGGTAGQPGLADAGSDSARPLRFTIGVALATLLLAAFVYRELGAIALVSLDADRELLAAPDTEPAPLAHWAERLERHLARSPDDAKSWYLLGHARMRQRDYGAAASAFEAVARLTSDDATVLASLAQARYLADGGTVTPTNRDLMARVLTLAPNETVVREILALDAMRGDRFDEAVTHLERALAGDVGGARADALRSALDRAREMGGVAQPGSGIDVAIAVDAAAGLLGDEAAIFVFARRVGERMPLLVAKVPPVSPVTTTRLDAGDAMQPGLLPDAGERLEIVARLAPTGKVGDASAGQTSVATVVWGEDAAAALSLQSQGADAAAPPTLQNRGDSSAAAGTGIALHVRLGATVNPPPGAQVYVIAREIHGMPMPVAVRPLAPTALPVDIVLTDADAMQPTRKISQFAMLEVVARLSRSGTAMRGEGDVESAAVHVAVGDAAVVELVIDSPR